MTNYRTPVRKDLYFASDKILFKVDEYSAPRWLEVHAKKPIDKRYSIVWEQ